MNRRHFLRTVAAAAALPAVQRLAPAAPARKPFNLLIVTVDDMNGSSSGFMGDSHGATPRLDAFAANAHRFVNNHLTAPICQPSRSALMTGRVPHRNGALGFNPIKPGVPTLVTTLQQAGYFAAVIDKQPHMQPQSQFPWDQSLGQSGKNPPLFQEHVAAAIKAAADAGKPFFLNANITDPHRPFPNAADRPARAARRPNAADPPRLYKPEEVKVPSFLEDLPDLRRELAQYYTALTRMDQSFHRLLQALKAAGREDDTVLVFLSDNGISMPFSKATVYHNGTFSPVLLRIPGMGRPQVRKEFVSSTDLMPTLLEILGVAAPEGMDGRSWVPLLDGQPQPGRDHVITHVNTVSSGKDFSQRCVRTADLALQFHAWPTGQPIFRVEAMSGLSYNALAAAAKTNPAIARRVEQYTVGTPLALYDLRADPDERTNLIADPARAKNIERLANLLLAHMQRTQDPQLDNFRKALASKR